jgi:pyrroloquinoline quinone biosynthesis protein E
MKLGLSRFRRRAEMMAPRSLIVHINSDCNFDCLYCCTKKRVSKGDLMTGDWLRVIDEASELGVLSIHFSGGEPLLHPDLDSILVYALDRIPKAVVFTNGSFITEAWVDRIKDLNVDVAIKFDSPSSYGFHTGRPDQYSGMLKAINLCVEAGVPVISFITLTRSNAPWIREMVNLAVELGTYPVVERFVPVDGLGEELEVGVDEWGLALNSIEGVYSEITDLYEDLNFSKRSLCGCYRSVLSISVDGDVFPCPGSVRDQSLGNVREMSLKAIWGDYKRMRGDWLKLPDECVGCGSAQSCGGGCKTYSYIKFGGYDKRDPLCKEKGVPPTLCHIGFLACNQSSKNRV